MRRCALPVGVATGLVLLVFPSSLVAQVCMPGGG